MSNEIEMEIAFEKNGEEYYHSTDKIYVMKRFPPGTISENGNDISWQWVLYHNDKQLDFNRYRHDLAGKHNLHLAF